MASTAVIAAYVTAIVVEVLGPLAAGFWAEGSLDVPWRLFLYGALVFLLSQVVVRLPLINLAGGALHIGPQTQGWALFGWLALLAATAAIVENVGRYLGYRYLLRDYRKTWNEAVMYGLGHGGLESILVVGLPMLLALSNILSLPGMDAQKLGLTPDQAKQLAAAKEQIAQLRFWMPLFGALERMLTLAFQASLSVLVAQVFRRHQWRWLGYAMALHFLLDLLAPAASSFLARPGQAGMPQLFDYIVPEFVVLLFASLAVYWAVKLRPLPEARARR